jgi:hypothetical protein
MTSAHIGPRFDCNDVTRLADDTVIHGVWVNGFAPLNGGGAAGKPLGLYIGRVWKTSGYGWVAAPLSLDPASDQSWSAEVQRSVRHFKTRKDACLFLYGYDMGVRRLRTQLNTSVPAVFKPTY